MEVDHWEVVITKAKGQTCHDIYHLVELVFHLSHSLRSAPPTAIETRWRKESVEEEIQNKEIVLTSSPV